MIEEKMNELIKALNDNTAIETEKVALIRESNQLQKEENDLRVETLKVYAQMLGAANPSAKPIGGAGAGDSGAGADNGAGAGDSGAGADNGAGAGAGASDADGGGESPKVESVKKLEGVIFTATQLAQYIRETGVRLANAGEANQQGILFGTMTAITATCGVEGIPHLDTSLIEPIVQALDVDNAKGDKTYATLQALSVNLEQQKQHRENSGGGQTA